MPYNVMMFYKLAQVKGYPGAQFKGFKCESEALSYLGQNQQRGGPLGVGLASGHIKKGTAQTHWDQGMAAALRAQHECTRSARLLNSSWHENRQASSSASQLDRPCVDPQQTYCLVEFFLVQSVVMHGFTSTQTMLHR
jgi:hypothetical protein